MQTTSAHNAPDATSSTSPAHPTMHLQNSSRLFDLPPELRNTIYAHVFDGSAQARRINIDNAAKAAPQIDLALTCRRIYNETTGLYLPSRRDFWSNNTFAIVGKPTYDKKRITAAHVDVINHITVETAFRSVTPPDVRDEVALHLTPIRPLPSDSPCWRFSTDPNDSALDPILLSWIVSYVDIVMTRLSTIRKVLVKKVPARTERYVLVSAPESKIKKCDLDRILEALLTVSVYGVEDDGDSDSDSDIDIDSD